MEDLFNPTVNLQPQGGESKGNSNEFKPKSSKNKKGVYEAIIRFLPNPISPSESLVSKNTAYLKNAAGQKREIDCSMDTYNDPVANTFFQLYNNQNPILKARANNFSRRIRYTALIQVISAPDEPQLVNKVMVFRFGKKVYDKIVAEQTPSSSGIVATQPHNIFSFTDGRPFYIKLTLQGGQQNFDDWSACAFIDNAADGSTSVKCPVMDAAGNVQYYPVNAQNLSDANFKQAVINWLNGEDIPQLEPYKYHEWDDETRQFVSQCIQEALNPAMPTVTANTTPTAAGIFGTAPTGPAGTPQASPAVPMGGPSIPMGGPNVPPVQPAAPAPAAPAPAFSQAPAAAPVNPVNPAPAPVAGLDFSAQAPQPATQPGGFAASNIPGLGDILGTAPGAPAPAAPQAAPAAAPAGEPTGGLQLGDILGEIM